MELIEDYRRRGSELVKAGYKGCDGENEEDEIIVGVL